MSPHGLRVALVDDDDTFRRVMSLEVESMGHVPLPFDGVAPLLEHLDTTEVDVVLLDVRMPGTDGLSGLSRIRDRTDPPEVIMLTGHGSIADAIESMKRGAHHYLTKPCRLDELELLLLRAGERRTLVQRNRDLVAHLSGAELPMVVGESEAMSHAMEIAERAAPADAPVLIEGETGTGKEMLARFVHRHSSVATGPFVIVNCGTLSEGVLQSELFGHERGAFTGADRRRQGLLELADGGTLFLDEIGEISPTMQVQLLRFLQFGELRRVGGNELLEVDVRIIAATNRRLELEVAARQFREDLYYRLNTIHITLPPLRERPDDIGVLVEYFLTQGVGGRDKGIEPDALFLLSRYHWPGNIRELRNIITRLAILGEGDEISARDVRRFFGQLMPPGGAAAALPPMTMKELEREHIISMLRHVGGNKREAAELLGIALKTLYNKINSYSIDLQNEL